MTHWLRFGGLLPFVGFRVRDVDELDRVELGLPRGTTRVEEFSVEWFNVGMVLCVRPVST